jgi:exopolyphosphatase/pppGpp-phosphohydrolase
VETRDYKNLEREALTILKSDLPSQLHYHGLNHTLEVLGICNQYIERSAIDPDNACLLRVGALLHDIGFTIANKNHEEESISLAGPLMDKYGFSQADHKVVEGLIRSTRVPQMPQNLLEEIICDADLDYLGREDFYVISERLFEELKAFGLVTNKMQWNKRQIEFMENHHYHTVFARENRQPRKEQRIRELKNFVAFQE